MLFRAIILTIDDHLSVSSFLEPTSAYRPWRRPRLTTDILPLRRLFDESAPVVNLPPILEQQQKQHASSSSEPTTPTTPTNPDPAGTGSVLDLRKLGSDGDEEGMSPTAPPRAHWSGASGIQQKQKRSSSLTTAMLSSQLGGSSLGNLHVITTTSASGVVTRSYFFAQRFEEFAELSRSYVCFVVVFSCRFASLWGMMGLMLEGMEISVIIDSERNYWILDGTSNVILNRILTGF